MAPATAEICPLGTWEVIVNTHLKKSKRNSRNSIDIFRNLRLKIITTYFPGYSENHSQYPYNIPKQAYFTSIE